MALTLSVPCCSGSLAKQTVEGNTPLHYSCSHNKPDCVKLLLKAKANIAISEWLQDPLLSAHIALLWKHLLSLAEVLSSAYLHLGRDGMITAVGGDHGHRVTASAPGSSPHVQ